MFSLYAGSLYAGSLYASSRIRRSSASSPVAMTTARGTSVDECAVIALHARRQACCASKQRLRVVLCTAVPLQVIMFPGRRVKKLIIGRQPTVYNCCAGCFDEDGWSSRSACQPHAVHSREIRAAVDEYEYGFRFRRAAVNRLPPATADIRLIQLDSGAAMRWQVTSAPVDVHRLEIGVGTDDLCGFDFELSDRRKH